MPQGTVLDPLFVVSGARDYTRIASGTSAATQLANSNGTNLGPGCVVLSLLSTSGTTPTINAYDGTSASNLLWTGAIVAGAPVVLGCPLKTGLYLTFGSALTQDLVIVTSG